MSAGRDLKILIKTIADMTGLSRLGRGVTEHSRSVRALGGIYRAAARAGAAGFRLVGSAIGAVNAGLRRLRNYAMVASAALTAIAVKGVKEWMDKDKSIRDLSATLEALGFNADALMPKMNALADEMQEITTQSDDATRALMNVLLNLGVMPDSMDEAVRGTVGLAKVMGIDATSAARYYAVALEGDYTMLRRYIPALRSATNDSERMAIVQRMMAVGFKQAQEEAKTLSGRFTQLRNRFGDFQARIGLAFADALNLENAFHRAERAVDRLIKSATWDTITDGLRTAFDSVMANVRTVQDLIAEIRSGDIGVDKIIQVGKVAVVEIVSVGVEAFLASLQAAHSAIAGIGSIVAASFLETILASDLPGMGGVRARMVKRAMPDPEMPHIPTSFVRRGQKDPYAQAHEAQQQVWDEMDRRRDEVLADPQRAASMVAGGDVAAERLQKGIDQFTSAVPGLIDRVTKRAGQAASTIGSGLREQTGFDYGGRKGGHLEDIGFKRVAEQQRAQREEERRRSERAAAQAAAEASKIAQQEAEIAEYQKRKAVAPFEERLGEGRGELGAMQARRRQMAEEHGGFGSKAGLEWQRLNQAISKKEGSVADVERAIAALNSDESLQGRVLDYMERVAENQRSFAAKMAIIENKISRFPI